MLILVVLLVFVIVMTWLVLALASLDPKPKTKKAVSKKKPSIQIPAKPDGVDYEWWNENVLSPLVSYAEKKPLYPPPSVLPGNKIGPEDMCMVPGWIDVKDSEKMSGSYPLNLPKKGGFESGHDLLMIAYLQYPQLVGRLIAVELESSSYNIKGASNYRGYINTKWTKRPIINQDKTLKPLAREAPPWHKEDGHTPNSPSCNCSACLCGISGKLDADWYKKQAKQQLKVKKTSIP